MPREHFYPHVPEPTGAPGSQWTTPTGQKDDVVSKRIHTVRWRSDYHLADAFAALSNMTRPGEQVAALAEKLYAAGNDTTLTKEQRDIFQTSGATFDLLSVFVPHVWIMKTVGTAAGIVAKALRNETITAQDILDINGAFKGVVDQGVQNAVLHQSTVLRLGNRGIKDKFGILRTPRYSDLITQLYYQKTFGSLTKDHQQHPLSNHPLIPPKTLSPARTALAQALPAGEEAAPERKILISPNEETLRTAQVRERITLQQAPPAQPAALPLPERDAVLPTVIEAEAEAKAAAEAAAKGALEINELELSETAESDNSVAVDSEYSELVESELSDVAVSVPMKARPSLIAAESLPERRWSDAGTKPWATKDRARTASLSNKAEVEVSIAIATNAPPPLSYASSEGIHMLLQADAAGNVQWRTLPHLWYRAAVVAPKDQMGVFSIGEQEYVSIDDHTYAVRDISETAMQVFNPADVSLPPLPVAPVDGHWRFNLMLTEKLEGIDLAAGIDGFIRVHNKKYVRIDGEVFEVERASIGGEERIAGVAQHITDALPSSDACGFIRWGDNKILIEGVQGYYIVRSIEGIGVGVTGADGKPVPMHYDHVLGRWHVNSQNESVQRSARAPSQPHLVGPKDISPIGRRGVFGSVTSLDIRSRIDQFPFSKHWPKLAHALELSFERLSSWRLIKPNRPNSFVSDRPIVMLYPIQAIRRAAYRLMPDIKHWNALSVMEKQRKAAAFTEEVYKSYFFLDQDLGAEAMCSEMTELLMVKMLRKLEAKPGMFSLCGGGSIGGACLLEVRIKESMQLGNSGRSHVALMAFKSREVMEAGFGDLRMPNPAGSPRLKEMSNGEFRAYVHEHRYELLLMDPWGPKKVIDFAMAGGVDAALSDFVTNLQEARFGDFSSTIGYTVQAFIPPRSGLASESSLEFDSNPFGLDD